MYTVVVKYCVIYLVEKISLIQFAHTFECRV